MGAIVSSGLQIAQGYQAQAEYNRQAQAQYLQAQGYEEQADLLNAEIDALDQNKKLEGVRYARQRKQVEGTVLARTAKSGFKLSGSPLTVLMNDLTQLQLDESIGRFNIEMDKYNVRAEQRQLYSTGEVYRSQARGSIESGKAARFAGYANAFTSLMKSASSAATSGIA